MKKLISATLLLFAACAILPAQGLKDKLDELGEQPLVSSADDKVNFDVLNYVRFGDHIIDSDFIDSGKSDEFVLNALDLNIKPLEWLGVNLGVNAKWDRFWAKKNQIFTLSNDGKVNFPADVDCKKSLLKVFSVGVPVNIAFFTGDWKFSVGGEALFALSSRTKTVFKEEAGDITLKQKDIMRGGNPGTAVWAWSGEVSYKDLGLYVRYCPKPVVKDAFEVKYTTIGFVAYF